MTRSLQPLLRPPSPGVLENIAKVLDITARLFPVPASHRKDLPHAARDLSRLLTEDRSEMARPYWASPALFSAYLHFFLPWNLFRLAWLLPGLDLAVKKDARVLDLGSGPLTLPLALWCARPDLRDMPLHFTCVDLSMQAMEHGRAILGALSGADPVWTIRLLRAPLETVLHGPARREETRPFDCIMAANVLNELGNERTRGETAPLEHRLGEVMRKALSCLAPEGRLLLVEPGNRLGGKVISLARAAAIDSGCVAVAPCPHSGLCPMRPRPEDAKSFTDGSFNGWCHFTHPAGSAPDALAHLSEEARLRKRSMAISCVLLQSPSGLPPRETPEDDSENALAEFLGLDELEALYSEIMEEDDQPGTATPAGGKGLPANHALPRKDIAGPIATRVISAPIHLPDQPEPGRYACCEHGLALLLNAERFDSGSLVEAEPVSAQSPSPPGRRRESASPPRVGRDRKSGALLLMAVKKERMQRRTAGGAIRKNGKQKPRAAQGNKTRAARRDTRDT